MIYFVILAAAALRFVPHMPNFAPITALAIFSGANLGWKKAVGITLAARLVSDLFLGFFSPGLMLAVYAAHLAGVLFGVFIAKTESYRWLKIIASSLGSSAIFFLVTNFAFLYAGYGHNLSGILLSYYNGLPFLRGTLIGDLGYSLALFGGYEALRLLNEYRKILKLANA